MLCIIFLSLENEELVQDLFSVEELEAVISRDDDDINLEVFFFNRNIYIFKHKKIYNYQVILMDILPGKTKNGLKI